MMKNLTKVSITTAMLLIAVPALATTSPKQVKEKVREVRATSTATSTVKKVEKMEDRFKSVSGKALEQLSENASKLDLVANKLESRVSKINNPAETASTTALIAVARKHISEARALFTSVGNVKPTAKTLGENVSKLRKVVNDVKAHLKSAREALVNALKALPKKEGENKANNQ